ncbi:unnamed protein product [Candidula unifasciata]|uniref:Borealin N-terminal domain-containing protein n=1 Tax=Candidula unifasciata TaxID=100452 RepID=A0A8S3Z0T2_9EUPU|nr:unnamed protein product [Candidula unifasciata]
MPRKRTTRLQSTKTHVKVESDDKGLTGKERTEQLQLFLRDYDSRVKTVLKDIEKKKRAMLAFIQTRFEQQISDLPFEIKDMTLEDFAKCGGTFEAALANVRAQAKNTTHNKFAELQNLKWNSTEEEKVLENIIEEGSEDTVPMFAQPTTVKAKVRSLKYLFEGKMCFLMFVFNIQGHRRSRCDLPPSTPELPTMQTQESPLRFMTPVSKMSQPLWGPTPLVTPKFDPTLPVTPENSREAKPGERFMSMAGSPILVTKNRRISEAVDKKEMAQQWSDIAGMDLTPTRVEQMLKAVAEKMNQK